MAPAELGPWVLEERVAAGAMGVVWRARHAATGLPAAIKRLLPERAAEPGIHQALGRELRLLATLDHPAILPLLDSGEHGGEPWIAMPWASGGTLADRLGTLPWPVARAIVERLLGGLAHAHARGVLHRDLKPANVLLGSEPASAWLADFGIALVLGETATGRVAGTPTTMAPEQIRGARDRCGPWTDLYSLGCTVWSLVCGAPPFVGTPEALRDAHLSWAPPPLQPIVDVPERLEDWLGVLLRKAPESRFATAADALHALGELGGSTARSGRRVPVPPVATAEASATLAFDPEPGPVPIQATRPDPAPIPASWRAPDERPWFRAARARAGFLGDRHPPLLGQEAARDQLWSVLHRVHRSGRSEVVGIEGEPGSGAAALARWLVLRAVETGAAIDVGEGAPATDRVGLRWVEDCAREHLGTVRASLGERELVLITGPAAGSLPERVRASRVDEADLRALLQEWAGLDGASAARIARAANGLAAVAVRQTRRAMRLGLLVPGSTGFELVQDVELEAGSAQPELAGWLDRIEQRLHDEGVPAIVPDLVRWRRAAEAGVAPGLEARARLMEGLVPMSTGEMGRAIPVLEEALALALQVDDRDTEVRASAMIGTALAYKLHSDEAIARIEEAVLRARDLPRRLPWALGFLARSLFRAGRLGEAEARVREALALHERLGDSQGAARDLVLCATLVSQVGRSAEALGLLDRAEHLIRLRERAIDLNGLYFARGDVLASMGRWAEAEAAFQASLDLYRREGDHPARWPLMNIAYARIHKGDPVEARPLLEQVIELSVEGGMRDRELGARLALLAPLAHAGAVADLAAQLDYIEQAPAGSWRDPRLLGLAALAAEWTEDLGLKARIEALLR